MKQKPFQHKSGDEARGELAQMAARSTSDRIVVSIEFSPLCTVELTTNWYHLHNGDYHVK